MKAFRAILLACFIAGSVSVFAQSVKQIEGHRFWLPNGWGITPVGNALQLGDLPLNMLVSPDKKLLAVTNNGQSTQSIQLFDI
ncbi:MAG TPA: hypothetical protein VG603_10655, partial [Chitinophagales bacterium]|nr:hypothetical protein [Chitinophagales bacterium]